MRTVAFIPARGGSKGLKNKNVRNLCGLPLIAWPIKAAIKCSEIDDVVVTTDDQEIASIAMKYGAKVPFIRPSELAGDLSTTEETLKHALENYELKYKKVDLCVFLTCTDIFRNSEWLEEAVLLMKNKPELESVFSGHQTHKNFWQKNKDGKWERLQEWMKTYSSRQIRRFIVREDTGLCCVSRSKLWKEGKRIGDNVEILLNKDLLTSIDIHTIQDLKVAEKLLPLRLNGEI